MRWFVPEQDVEHDLHGDCVAQGTTPNPRQRTRREASRSNERISAEPGAETRQPAAAFFAGSVVNNALAVEVNESKMEKLQVLQMMMMMMNVMILYTSLYSVTVKSSSEN